LLKKQGFHTAFYFGGNLDYGNLRAFLLYEGFDRIVEQKDLNRRFPSGKLGVHDQYMFDYFLQEIRKTPQPFFNILFTLSSHSPYDQPKNTPLTDILSPQTPFLNSVKYTDYWLGKFLENIKKESWYDRTLVILLADHGHPSHLQRDFYSAHYQHIPMLWLGGALKDEYRGKTWDKTASHADFSPTLLHQLNIPSDSFVWGKNALNPYAVPFAYFEIPQGFGAVTTEAHLIYSTVHSSGLTAFVGNDSLRSPLLLYAKSYMQTLFDAYLSY
jgi:phosphoglycerol transferase MdoB-like AlkP superfamily enzyme